MPELVLLTSTETVALIRDILLIVFLSLGFIVLAVILVFALSLYRRLTKVLDTVEGAIERIEGAVSTTKGVLTLGGLTTRIFKRIRRS